MLLAKYCLLSKKKRLEGKKWIVQTLEKNEIF